MFHPIKTFVMIIFFLFGTSMYGETITIERSKLETLIRTEVQKAIDSAVTEAVAIAIRDTELKYIAIVRDKDIQIADLNGIIDKKLVEIEALKIQKENLKIEFINYKNQVTVNYIFIGGVGFVSGLVVFGVGNVIFPFFH